MDPAVLKKTRTNRLYRLLLDPPELSKEDCNQVRAEISRRNQAKGITELGPIADAIKQYPLDKRGPVD